MATIGERAGGRPRQGRTHGAERCHVALIATGGTIASASPSPDEGYSPRLSAEQLLNTIPGWEQVAAVDFFDFAAKPSFALTVPDVLRLARLLEECLADSEITGAVVLVGTAAVEEVSYLLDLLLVTPKPVVMTGAMLPASRPGTDGPRNLHDALRVAADTGASGLGVLVTLGGEVHAARDVQKLHRTSPTPLVSWPGGPLGVADADRVVWLRDPRGRIQFGLLEPTEPVDIVRASLGCDERLIEASVATGARGLVVEGFPGGGGVTFAMMGALERVVERGIPVVATSRSPLGRVVSVAGGGSGPSDLLGIGAIPAGDLSASKARLLLMCTLSVAQNIDDVRSYFARVSA